MLYSLFRQRMSKSFLVMTRYLKLSVCGFINIKYTKFVHLKCFRNNTLFFVTTDVFGYFIAIEFIIQQYLPHLNNIKCNLISFFMKKKQFILDRIKIACIKGRLVKPIYKSKTMAMHSMIK
ncbi:hypothetical protein ACFW04_012296 [Cataglyphis niger]